MALTVKEINDSQNFRQLLALSYSDLVPFIFKYIKKPTVLIIFFWLLCAVFLGIAILNRINIASEYSFFSIFLHSVLGFAIFPILCIPVHEALHIIPYFLSGARNIRTGMDLKQYIFYVTAHRYVAAPVRFIIVALIPFILISFLTIVLIIILPGLWKWSLSVFLFAHATMCAGDFALLNFYYVNRGKKIYTWDDADEKMAYFYEQTGKNDGVTGR